MSDATELAGQVSVGSQSEMQPQVPEGMQVPQYNPAGYSQALAQQLQQQSIQLRMFWEQQHLEIQQVGTDPAEFKNHQLPLARIKKIMKSDEDVRMISAEAPVLFAKACEMFILELTLRSWNHSEENKRRTLQRNDIAAAITRTDIFDFLVDIVPREERDDAAMIPRVAQPMSGAMTGVGPQGYAWPPPNMMPPNMQTDPSFRPSVAMDPSMIPPYYGTGVPQQQQWQPQTMPVSQGLPQTHPQPEQPPSQQNSNAPQQ
ncbi:hypothetical protein WJX77_003009 [Trebouxia sp. C0004]